MRHDENKLPEVTRNLKELTRKTAENIKGRGRRDEVIVRWKLRKH